MSTILRCKYADRIGLAKQNHESDLISFTIRAYFFIVISKMWSFKKFSTNYSWNYILFFVKKYS